MLKKRRSLLSNRSRVIHSRELLVVLLRELRRERFKTLSKKLVCGGNSIMECKIMKEICLGTRLKMQLRKLLCLRNRLMIIYCNSDLERNLGLIFRSIKMTRWGYLDLLWRMKSRRTRVKRRGLKCLLRIQMMKHDLNKIKGNYKLAYDNRSKVR